MHVEASDQSFLGCHSHLFALRQCLSWLEAHWLAGQWAPPILPLLPSAGIASMCPLAFYIGPGIDPDPLSLQPSNSVILNIFTGLCNYPCRILYHLQTKSKLILTPVLSISYKWNRASYVLLCLISLFITMVGSLICIMIIWGFSTLHFLYEQCSSFHLLMGIVFSVLLLWTSVSNFSYFKSLVWMYALCTVRHVLGTEVWTVELPDCPCPAPSYILTNSKGSLQCLYQHFPCLSPPLRLHQMNVVFLWSAFLWLMKSSTFPCIHLPFLYLLWDISSQTSFISFQVVFSFSEFFKRTLFRHNGLHIHT